MYSDQKNRTAINIVPIGYIRTPYKEKFSVPRQPNLVPSARCQLFLTGQANHSDAIQNLNEFSHLWLLFLFDQHLGKAWSHRVRPPRLGGNKSVGVFASRSSFRPNFIGLSVVKLVSIQTKPIENTATSQIILELMGADLVDNTPIIDIKPYISYSDCISEVQNGYVTDAPANKAVLITDCAKFQLQQLMTDKTEQNYVQQVIIETLSLDPRPAYRTNKEDFHQYAVHLFDFNIRFHVELDTVFIDHIELVH